MTLAHEGSRLALKNKVPALPEGMILFPLAGGVENTTADIPIISEQGLTFREDEKRFFGSVAVESSTTNLLSGTALIFESGWSASQGSIITRTQNVLVREWNTNKATRFQTTGGTSVLKAVYQIRCLGTSGVPLSSQIKVKNIGNTNFRLRNQYEGSDLVRPGETKHLFQRTLSYNSATCYQFRFETDNVDDSLDVIVFEPQAEELDHHTSFVNGTRPVGNLSYDISHLGMRDAGCIACWVYNSDAMVNNRFTGRTQNNQYIIKTGRGSANHHDDALTLWVQNVTPRRFAFWSSANTTTDHINSLQNVDQYGGVGAWNHFVLQWDKNELPSGNKKEFYINGVRQGANNTPNLPVQVLGSLKLGQWNDNGHLMPSTLFEQLAIHPSKGFSAEEIRNWYNANAPFYDFRDTMLRW